MTDKSGDADNRMIFRPAARMASVVGEQLIRDNTTGVLELVKNGYDADATHVWIELNELDDPENTKVVILDDGDGMDESTIRGPWSEPAHGGKEREKVERIRTARGRLPLGEKGVGRFATQKIGRILDMTTRPRNDPYEYHVRIDWKDFDRPGAYLDEVPFYLEKRDPVTLAGDRHGTRLEITGANEPWSRVGLEKLQTRLMRLLSPTRDMHDFGVSLKCQKYQEFENLDRSDVSDKYQFRIDCRIDERGMASYDYCHRKRDGSINRRTDESNLWSQVNKNWKRADPVCGPIKVTISAWLRTVGNLEEYGLTRRKLSDLCGVSIYRDGFRIIPYGDEGDDWLKLDRRRTVQPGETYGNNQVIGQVEIEQDKNGGLVDKTSREGLQENQAFFDMRDLTLGVMILLETESSEGRNEDKPKKKTTNRQLKKQITELKDEIEKMKEDKSKSDGNETDKPEDAAEPEGESNGNELVHAPPKTVNIGMGELESLVTRTEEIGSAIKEMAWDLGSMKDTDREEFLHLMGIGMMAERFCHEFDRLVGSMDAYVGQLENKHPHYGWVKNLRRALDALKNEVALMDNARYAKRDPEGERINVREIVMRCMESHKKMIESNQIQTELDSDGSDFYAKMPAASLTQAIDNVMTNAIHWLGEKTEKNNRKMHISMNATDRNVVISNNGTRIPQSTKRVLFNRPFTTTKPGGRGLGMYITNEILSRYGSTVTYLEEDDRRNRYGSAAFMIQFSDDQNQAE